MPCFVVDFPEFDVVRLAAAVCSADLAPFGIGGAVAVFDPVEYVLRVVVGTGVAVPSFGTDVDDNQGLGADGPAHPDKFVGPEAIDVEVVPDFAGVRQAFVLWADALLPLIGRSEAAARPSDDGGL